jgi:hypothetical protein
MSQRRVASRGFGAARLKYVTKFTSEKFANPGRLATIYVMLQSVWRLLRESPMGDVFAEFTQEFTAALDEAIIKQGKAVTDETEIERFLTGIRELISSTPSCLEGDDANGNNRYLGKVTGKKIGDTIFLLPKMTLSELERLKIFSQAPSVASLTKELNDRGLLKAVDKGHLQSRQVVGGRQVRGWWLVRGWDGSDPPQTGGGLEKIDPLLPVRPLRPPRPQKNNNEISKDKSIMNIDNELGNGNNSGLSGLSGLKNRENRERDINIISSLSKTTLRPLSPVASTDSDYNNAKEIIKYEKSLRSARMTADFGNYKKGQIVRLPIDELRKMPCVLTGGQDVCRVCGKEIKQGDVCKHCRWVMTHPPGR